MNFLWDYACLIETQSKYVRSWSHEEYRAVRDPLIVIQKFYSDDGRYPEAEALCRQIHDHDKKLKGESSEGVVESEIRLAGIHLLQGQFKEAEGILTRLQPNVEQYPEETRISLLKNLAKVSFKLGRYDEALQLYQDVLVRQETSLPKGDLGMIDTRHLLAQVYRNQGKHEDAIEIYTKILDVYHAASLDDHLGALQCMVDLAGAYRALAQYSQAAEYYDRAIAGISVRLSADHPSALSSRLVRAINLRELNRTEEAEDAFRDTVERFGRVLGSFHQDTLRAIMNFAILYDRTNRPERAEELYRAALVGREKIMGFDNQYTMRTVERLASLLWSQDRCDEAETLALRALRGQRKLLLEEDIQSLNIRQVGNDEKRPYWPVEVLFMRAVERDSKLLGKTHTDRIEAERSLAAVYARRDRDGWPSDETDFGTRVGHGKIVLAVSEETESAGPPPSYSAFDDSKKLHVSELIVEAEQTGL